MQKFNPKFPQRSPLRPINFDQSGVYPSNAFATKLPANFNPRKESNMHHREKVDKWIIQVPTYPSSTYGRQWDNSCYNPTIGLSDHYEDEEPVSFDFSNSRDVIEFQSRVITFLFNRDYYQDFENVRKCGGQLSLRSNKDFEFDYDQDYDNDSGESCDVEQYEQFKDYQLKA